MLEQLITLLVTIGPWVVFVATFIETALFIGLLIPAEPLILLASFLAKSDRFAVEHVLAATFFGGLLGDQVGYLLGRYGGPRKVAKGPLARIWQRHEPRALRLFQRQAALSVSLARFVSFVRTLMPWFAGMSRMSYGKYLLYDLLGVAGWAAGSVALGYIAGHSYERLAHRVGTGTALVFAVIILVAGIGIIRKRKMQAAAEAAVATEKPLRVGLTGNIASGKSTVVKVWRDLGAQVIDADVLARRAVEPGSAALQQIAEQFGPSVLDSSGALDRAKMRGIVFEDPDRRRQLEAIVHPEVLRLRQIEEDKLHAQGVRVIVHDIPLLFETGLADQFDLIVFVDAPEQERLRRLIELRGIAPEEAGRMIAAQMPAEEKKPLAHIVIPNEETLEKLEQDARDVWSNLVVKIPGSDSARSDAAQSRPAANEEVAANES